MGMTSSSTPVRPASTSIRAKRGSIGIREISRPIFVSLGSDPRATVTAPISVSRSNVPAVIEYIKNQRERHKHQTFEEEYIELLKLHQVDYDERYVFD